MFDAAFRYYRKNIIQFGYWQTYRVFIDNLALHDKSFSLTSVLPIQKSVYIDVGLTYAPTPVFFPTFSLAIEPHWVLPQDLEISLGLKSSAYPNALLVGTLSQNIQKTFSDNSLLQFKLFETWANRLILSAMLSWDQSLWKRWGCRLTIGLGDALEGPGSIGKFFTAVTEIKFYIFDNLILKANGSFYNGEIRSDRRLGLGLETWF